MSTSLKLAYRSECGPRAENEDAIGALQLGDGGLAVAMADGLGGHFGGAAAAQLAVSTFLQAMREEPERPLIEVARSIHENILSEQKANPRHRGMATTFTAAVCTQDKLRGVHSGDTRIALIRGDGVKRLTEDHTEAQRLFAAGKLSRAELAAYPRKNILESALGASKNLRIDEVTFDLNLGDRIVLTSDGVHGKIMLRELQAIVRSSDGPESAVDSVLSELARRGPEDNYSIACIFLEREDEQ